MGGTGSSSSRLESRVRKGNVRDCFSLVHKSCGDTTHVSFLPPFFFHSRSSCCGMVISTYVGVCVCMRAYVDVCI